MESSSLQELQLSERVEADLQMLIDTLAVELPSHSGELDLAMQRLVRDAEQRAVRHAEPESIGRDRRRFHVERNGTRLRQTAYGRGRIAELPVAIVDAGDGAGAHNPLELVADEPRHLADRMFEGDLDLGERR